MKTEIRRRQRQTTILPRTIKRRSQPSWPYTYDYDDEEFLEFFRGKTGIQVGLELRPIQSRKMLIGPDPDEWIRTTKKLIYIKTKQMVPFGEPREIIVDWNKTLRDNMQKYWIQYQETKLKKIRRR